MMRSLLRGVLAAALLSACLAQAPEQKPLAADDNPECVHPPYKAHIFSRSPLVIYISDFLTPSERAHMLDLAKDNFQRSEVNTGNGTATNQYRTSSSTTLPLDSVTRCIEARAASFQGLHTPRSHVEPLQLVRYHRGEHYHFHTDWFPDPAHTAPPLGGQRVSSFFGYVDVAPGTTGGGTNFPSLDPPPGEEWCSVVDCDAEYEAGVTFRPVAGNVVYWENVVDGEGDVRTLHAGMPVTGGRKVGLNIWTREGPLGEHIKWESR